MVAAVLQEMKKQLYQVQDNITILRANTTLLNGRYRSVYCLLKVLILVGSCGRKFGNISFKLP